MRQEEPQKQPRIPELQVGRAVQILKDRFSVVADPVPDRPYYLRFKLLGTGEEIQGFTHAKGTLISPLFLGQILERFGIPLLEFLEALKEPPGPQIVK